MNSSGNQSFYEIQLNNRHLIVAFVAAVVLGIAIFSVGVMVGRGLAPQELPEEGWVERFGADAKGDDTPDADYEYSDRLRESTGGEDDGTGGAANLAAGDAAGPADTPAVAEQPTTEAPAPARAASLPVHDASLAEGWVIQVKSTRQRNDADGLQASLAGAGYPAFVVSADVDGVIWFRVRVGRYRERGDADVVARGLDVRADVESTWVTRG